jgi:hypothetical protein
VTLKLADLVRVIDEAAAETIKTEFKNVFASIGTESAELEAKQLATGFDRLIAFHAMALELAAKKFKDAP